MKPGPSALVLLLATPVLAQKPLVLDAALDKTYATWALPVKVGDRAGYFLVRLDRGRSHVNRGWLGKDSPEMSVGGMSLGNAFPQSAEEYKVAIAGRPIVGVPGANALSRFAVGFDWGASKVSLWRNVKPEDAAAFVGGRAERIPLGRRAAGMPTVEATRNGRKLTLALWSHYAHCTLRAADRLREDVELYKSFVESDAGRN